MNKFVVGSQQVRPCLVAHVVGYSPRADGIRERDSCQQAVQRGFLPHYLQVDVPIGDEEDVRRSRPKQLLPWRAEIRE